MKKIVFILFICLISFPVSSSAKEATLRLVINDKAITSGATPISIKGTTYIPLRNLFENINFTVSYDAKSQTVAAYYINGPIKLSFEVNSDIVGIDSMFDNGQSINVRISGKPIIHKNAVYVPMRAFGELFGARLSYDPVFYGVFFSLSDQELKDKIYPRVGIQIHDDLEEASAWPGRALNPPTAKEIYNELAATVGYVEVVNNYNEVQCTGSGFMANPGVLITNEHVASCDPSGRIIVKLAGNTYTNGTDGWYIFENKETDLYGVSISTSFDSEGVPTGAVPPYYFNLYDTGVLPEIGDKVYAIGSPLGLENTISEGIVSGIRKIDGITYIQHTCDTQAGSSGGVLVDEYGYLIGVTSSGIEGTSLNFAIPISYILDEYAKIGIELLEEE